MNTVRMLMEANPTFTCLKCDLKMHTMKWPEHRAAIVEELEADPTMRHLAWHAATVLAPQTGLEIGV